MDGETTEESAGAISKDDDDIAEMDGEGAALDSAALKVFAGSEAQILNLGERQVHRQEELAKEGNQQADEIDGNCTTRLHMEEHTRRRK